MASLLGRSLVGCWLFACVAAGASAAPRAPLPPTWDEIDLRAGMGPLFRLLHAPGKPEPETAVLTYIRLLHATGPLDARRVPLRGILRYLAVVEAIDQTLAQGAGRAQQDRFFETTGLTWIGSGAGATVQYGAAVLAGRADRSAAKTTVLEPNAAESRSVMRESGLLDVDALRDTLNAGKPFPLDIPVERIVLPLSADVWCREVFDGKVDRAGLAVAILGDPNALLLYAGLYALDVPTRSS